MATRRKKFKTSQTSVRSNNIVQKGGNIHAQELIDILTANFKGILGEEIVESQVLYQNAKYYYSAGEYSGALVSFACASVLLNTIMRRLKAEKGNSSIDQNILDDTIMKTENVLNCCLISVEELQAIVRNNTVSGKNDEDNKPKDWEKICVKIQPLVFKKGSSNCIFYEDVIGLESQKDQIEHSFVFPLLYPNLYPKVSKGILIYGPPGTGKTLIVKAAVNQLQSRSQDVGVLYFTPSPGDLKGKYVGETEKKIEEWFMCASQKACDQERDCKGKKFISIIFMDEIDSIARDRSQDSSGLAANSVNTLLQMMDGIGSKENVAVIGATNYPWDLDSAILRRFDTQILIGLPERQDKKKLLDYEVNRYLDIKLKISTVCDKKSFTDASEELNNNNADKCGIQCERVKEAPHINDPFIKKFSIDYYKDLENETDSAKLSRVSGIVNILEEKNFTNSDISRFVKTAARRAGELSIKCNIFYNTSIVGDTRNPGEDRYMSSLTRIENEDTAINASIQILESFKKEKEHNDIYQIEPPKISIIQYNGHNYYNMKCILYKNSDMIMDFPLLENMFIKGEKFGGPKITVDEYKAQILNQKTTGTTDIIMSFNVNFEKTTVPPPTAAAGTGPTPPPTGVLMFPSQLVNYVYSSVIGVYLADPNNSTTIKNPAHIPNFFNSSNYTYIYDKNEDTVEKRINDEVSKLVIDKCNFDFFSFLLLSKVSGNVLINNTETYCEGLMRELTGTIERPKDASGSFLNNDDLRNKAAAQDPEVVLKEDVKIKSGNISFFYPTDKGKNVFIQYKDYIKLINYFDVYSKLFPVIIADITDADYIQISTNLFCLLFYDELNGQIPLYKQNTVNNSEILLMQLYLNSALRLVINYEKNTDYSRFSKCMLVKFLEYFTEIDLIEQYINAADKEKDVNDKEILAKNAVDTSVKSFTYTNVTDAQTYATNIITDAVKNVKNIFQLSTEDGTLAKQNINTAQVIDAASAKKMIDEAALNAKQMIDAAVSSAKNVIITALETEKKTVTDVNAETIAAKKAIDTAVQDFPSYTNVTDAKTYATNIITDAVKNVKNIFQLSTEDGTASKNKINTAPVTDEASAKKMINEAAADAKKMINEAVKATKTDVSGKVVAALGNLFKSSSAPVVSQSAPVLQQTSQPLFTGSKDLTDAINSLRTKDKASDAKIVVSDAMNNFVTLINQQSVNIDSSLLSKPQDEIKNNMKKLIDEILIEVNKLLDAAGDAALKIQQENGKKGQPIPITSDINNKISKIKKDIKIQAEIDKNSFTYNLPTDKDKGYFITSVINDIVDVQIIQTAAAEINRLIDDVEKGGPISGGGSRRSSSYRKRNQSGGAIDNDIMSYIFRLILQEKYICDSWYLFYNNGQDTFKDTSPYDNNAFNDKFDSVYKSQISDPNERLVNFYNQQQALINNTNVGDIHTKEIFLATKFNFNAIYELNRPNIISTVGKSFSKAWTQFKNFITAQAKLSPEDQKSADNAILMNELVENNQLISVLFKEITAYGFLFDDDGIKDGFKVKSDNGADSEKFINVSWKNVELGLFVKFIEKLKDNLLYLPPEWIITVLLGYGAYSIGSVIGYMASVGIAGGIGIGLATLGLGPVLAVGAGLGLVAGGLTATEFIGGATGGATLAATGGATETAAVAATVATGIGAGALAAGAFGSWIVISNLYRFLYRKDVDAKYIINNIFITTLLNIITTVGKFTIDFNENLLDQLHISINKIVYENLGNVFWRFVTLQSFKPSLWSTSESGFRFSDIASSLIPGYGPKQTDLKVTRFKKKGITKKDINYSLFNINIPFQAFYYALIHVKSSYNDQLGKDLIDYNTNRDKFLADKEKRDKEKRR